MPRHNPRVVEALRVLGFVTVEEVCERHDQRPSLSTVREWANRGYVRTMRHGHFLFVEEAAIHRPVRESTPAPVPVEEPPAILRPQFGHVPAPVQPHALEDVRRTLDEHGVMLRRLLVAWGIPDPTAATPPADMVSPGARR